MACSGHYDMLSGAFQLHVHIELTRLVEEAEIATITCEAHFQCYGSVGRRSMWWNVRLVRWWKASLRAIGVYRLFL